MNKLRVAIIGTGMIANSAHFPALNELRKEGIVDVVAVADIREEVAIETAKRHNVEKYYSDPQKMLDEVKPDIFFVNSDGTSDEKKAFVEAKGIRYVTSSRIPHGNLPERSTTSIRQTLSK